MRKTNLSKIKFQSWHHCQSLLGWACLLTNINYLSHKFMGSVLSLQYLSCMQVSHVHWSNSKVKKSKKVKKLRSLMSVVLFKINFILCFLPLVAFSRLSSGLYEILCNLYCVQCNVGAVCLFDISLRHGILVW